MWPLSTASSRLSLSAFKSYSYLSQNYSKITKRFKYSLFGCSESMRKIKDKKVSNLNHTAFVWMANSHFLLIFLRFLGSQTEDYKILGQDSPFRKAQSDWDSKILSGMGRTKGKFIALGLERGTFWLLLHTCPCTHMCVTYRVRRGLRFRIYDLDEIIKYRMRRGLRFRIYSTRLVVRPRQNYPLKKVANTCQIRIAWILKVKR